ncbi:MAG: YkgJ family cysteine cluster protein [Syntrophales bacterium]|nr:YkgJ family cysteine cluster protein [Syntrophales bacterium]MDY0045151.1 YkgJ family cysteine cluster protein [Syntrophales bacterium]
MIILNPCLSCGACCAFYRISFYWAETSRGIPGGVPEELTEKMDAFRVFMKGSAGSAPRCIALQGDIGSTVLCGIYSLRSSVCRAFEPSWEKGIHNIRCDKARIAWGLVPLTPDSWHMPHVPKVA